MKKIYDAPEVHLHCVKLQNMIALSLTDEEADPTLDVLSRRRRRSAWDDEDDNENEY